MNPNDTSETSTTDGYITATDSMSGITTTAQGISHTTSSFDSVSSHFSLNKTDTFEEIQQVCPFIYFIAKVKRSNSVAKLMKHF